MLGVLGFIVVRGVGPAAGRAVVVVCGSLIALVALSRLYLAAEWPSDVAAGLLFGAALTAMFALAFHDERVSLRAALTMAATVMVAGLAVGGLQLERGFDSDPFFLERGASRAVVMPSSWRDEGWKTLAHRRIDLAGETEEPILLQWSGSPSALRDALIAQGWSEARPWSLENLNGFAFPDTSPVLLPVVPRFHDGERAVITAVLPVAQAPRWRTVLRVWPERVRDPAGQLAVYYVGAVDRERVDHPFNQLSIPVRSRNKSCDATDLLARLPSAAIVGEEQASEGGFCGGKTVLAGG